MIKIFNGRLLDVDTNAPIIAARIYPNGNPSGGVATADDGSFSLAADDSTLSTWYQLDAVSQGYGDAVQQLGGLQGDIFLYKTDAGAVSKVKAVLKNGFLPNLILILAILLILFISKKYIQ